MKRWKVMALARLPMRPSLRSIVLLGAGLLTSVAVSAAPVAADTQFTVSAQVLSGGPCDPRALLVIQAGPFDPFTRVGVTIDYPGGQHEGANTEADVNGVANFGFGQSPTSLLIGGTTTINVFLDADLDLQPDAGSPVVTTTVTYCPPPLAAEECKKGAFESFPNLAFKNQGDCVSYVETAGRNPPAG